MTSFIKLMRPKHFVKNILIFAPIVYAGSLGYGQAVFSAFMAFVAFCLAASAVYVVNDIVDCKKDALHPVNKFRPIASGKISKRAGAVFSSFLVAAGFGLAGLFTNWIVLVCIAFYVLLNLLYTYWLKNVPVLDCFCVAGGFVIRIFAGGAAVDVAVSEWLFLTVLAGALFMAFGKRRGEMAKLGKGNARRVLEGYELNFLNGMVYGLAGISIVFYAMWAITSTDLMIYTVPLVIFIICKYLLNSQKEDSLGDPVSIIFADYVLVTAVIIFGILSGVFLYL